MRQVKHHFRKVNQMSERKVVEQILHRAEFLKKLRAPMIEGHPNRIVIQAELEALVGLTKAKRLLSDRLK